MTTLLRPRLLLCLLGLSILLLTGCNSHASRPDEAPREVHPRKEAPPTHQLLARKTERLLSRAHELIGIPYRWGGTTVEQGFDCSGLLVYLFQTEAGVQLPRTTSAMLADQQAEVKRKNLRPGDAVFFNRNGRGRIGHVGLYLGEGRFIHAPRTGKSIRVDSLDQRYWKRSFTAARRYLN